MTIAQRRPSFYFGRLSQILLLTALVLLLGCSKGSKESSKQFDPDAYLWETSNEFDELLKKAKANDIEAQVQVAQKLLRGEGVTKDEVQAKKWFESAEKTGNGVAQYFLGQIYQNGLGIPKDSVKAFAWYEKSAAQDTVPALSALAAMYYLGEGTVTNGPKSVEFWEKAVAKGDVQAELNLGIAYEGKGPVERDLKKAVQWYEKAVIHESEYAQVNLGYLYLDGPVRPKDQSNPFNKFDQGLYKDNAKAFSLFQKAAEKGYPNAQYSIGYMYIYGLGIPKDLSKAAEWIQKAAEGNYDIAQYEIGKRYFYGIGVPKDNAKAAEWIKKAAIKGYVDAQVLYSQMQFWGQGIPEDKVLGYAWANIAAASGDKFGSQSRDVYEVRLSIDEKLEAQQLSSNWKKGTPLSREESSSKSIETSSKSRGQLNKQGTGTGFLVSKSGLAVTNHHVIDGCKEVRTSGTDGVVKVKASDMVNDLALIAMPNQVTEIASLQSNPAKLRQGDDVVVFGFPLNTVLSSGGNLTPGVVSALTGLGNNTNQIQITAAIQPGSSGSPVINKMGDVVAVVSMKLSDAKMAQATGQVAQTVNFAVGGQTLKSFLTSQGVEFSTSSFRFFEKSTADLADEARKWTVLLECWK